MNKRMKVLVMGGIGKMGSIAVRDLVENTQISEIVIADLNVDKAKELAKEEASKVKDKKISAVYGDITNRSLTSKLAKDASVFLNTTPITTETGRQNAVPGMRIALESGTHWVDICSTYEFTLKQLELDNKFKEKNLTAVLGAGAAPGITNVIVRWAVDRLDEVESIHNSFGGVSFTKKTGPISFPYSLQAILEQFTDPEIKRLKNGKIIKFPALSDPEMVDFPEPIGRVECVSIRHPEAATYPRYFGKKGLKNLSVKLAYSKELVEKLKFLIDIGLASKKGIDIRGTKVVPYDVLLAVLSRLPVIRVEPRDYSMWKIVVKGKKSGENIEYTLFHPGQSYAPWHCGSSAFRTGICASIVTEMLCTGNISERGVFAPEGCVPPEKFFQELTRRGLEVSAIKKTIL